nr:KrmR [uncultured bacterium]
MFYDPQVSRFDMTLIAEDHGEELITYIEYNNELFDAESMDRFASHFQTLLEQMVATPDQPIEQLPMLTEAERQQVLLEWNDTRADYPRNSCLHHLFEEQVQRTPEATALVFDAPDAASIKLTYRELNERANQLAHYLMQQGVGPETLVGICAERSIEMVVGLYGILKAGGAYVPLDPTYPQERLAVMMADAQVPVLLTQAHLCEQLPAHEAQTLCLDADWRRVISPMPVENPDSGIQAEHLAYVIYTSGSTGKPKGAMNAHRGVVNRLLWMQDAYGLRADDHILQKTPFSFDVSVWEFFWPLFTGARLVVAQPEGHQDPSYLVSAIRNHQITTLHFVPPMLSIFLEAPEVETCDTLRRVICSGQALPYELQKRFFSKLSAELHNLYGPTEAAIDVTYWACQPESEQALVPIGRPVANTQIYLLDEHLAPVPIGLPGELHIGGVQVGRGYHHRPELTEAQFIPNPFAEDQERSPTLYKTGDLARWLPDGSIDFIGRLDDQAKLRGFRIELGEIESVLNAHPAVQETLAMVREDEQDQRLVAYLVPDLETAYPIRQQLHLQHDGTVTEDQTSYDLPNGMTLYYQNRSETDFMYREIFEDHCYLRHGISLPQGSCVFDVGANVGLFSLFVHQACPNAQVYAFEPIPDIFDLLRINTALYGVNANLFAGGLASTNRQDRFTYYPHVSILSGRFADAAAEQEVVRTFLLNEDTAHIPEAMLQDMLEERLTSQDITCEFKTLSAVIQENQIDTIDLLKVDVEKSELDILQGIAPHDWPKIKQMVLEVHDDAAGSFQKVTQLLDTHGFEYVIEQEEMLKDTNLYSIYAKQPASAQPASAQSAATPAVAAWSSVTRLTDDLRTFLQQKLPSYMIPSAFMMLETLPATPNGKVDRNALPDPDASFMRQRYEPPGTPTEAQLAVIWQTVLGIEQVGRQDDFFTLGGHSLLAPQVILQVGHAFEIELPLRQLLSNPTLSELAQRIDSTRETLAGLQDMTSIGDDEADELEELVL